jgi:membrane-associated phospholipid phosphatase
MSSFFLKFFRNIAKCFRGKNLLWHLLAIILTYAIVASGVDWLYFVRAQNPAWRGWFFPAVELGGLLPILVPLVLFAVAAIGKGKKILNTASALTQSALGGLLVSDFYKAFTGRIHPPRLLLPGNMMDISHGFRFGFLQGGVFWGWPSTHTTIAFAMAAAIFVMYPQNKILKYTALIYAFYVGFGVSIGIHWFSEFVAGAIIGSVIGVVVGKSFAEDDARAK